LSLSEIGTLVTSVELRDIIASLALLISTISIMVQILSLRKQLLRHNFSDYTKRYSDIMVKMPKEVINPYFDIFELDKDKQEEVIRAIWPFFDLCYEEYCLYRERLISRRLWNIWKHNMRLAMQRRSFYQAWGVISTFSHYEACPEFLEFFNSLSPSKAVSSDPRLLKLLESHGIITTSLNSGPSSR
jgi:hypothetical protein